METEKGILQMLELLLARQEEAEARAEDRHQEAVTREEAAAARQEKRNAEAKVHHERFLARLD
jgi:hypothetical protein